MFDFVQKATNAAYSNGLNTLGVDPGYLNSNGFYEAGSLKPWRSNDQSERVEQPWFSDQWGTLSPAYLKSVGFTGNPWEQTAASNTGVSDSWEPPQKTGYSPELKKWMADNGLTSQISQGESGTQQMFFKGDTPYGPGTRWGNNDDAFNIAAILAGGAIGTAAAGVGAGAAAGAVPQSSSTAAALYGDVGYGAGAGAVGGGAGGTVPERQERALVLLVVQLSAAQLAQLARPARTSCRTCL